MEQAPLKLQDHLDNLKKKRLDAHRVHKFLMSRKYLFTYHILGLVLICVLSSLSAPYANFRPEMIVYLSPNQWGVMSLFGILCLHILAQIFLFPLIRTYFMVIVTPEGIKGPRFYFPNFLSRGKLRVQWQQMKSIDEMQFLNLKFLVIKGGQGETLIYIPLELIKDDELSLGEDFPQLVEEFAGHNHPLFIKIQSQRPSQARPKN